jgi:hypothetical protein
LQASGEAGRKGLKNRSRILGGTLAACALVLAVLGVAGSGPLRPVFHRPISLSANGGIAKVEIRPIPEGPAPSAFERVPTTQHSQPIALIELYVPDPLPAPLNQWLCHLGGNLTVTLGNGKEVTYGPCHRPASIDHLWAEMSDVLSNGECAPRCGPGGKPGP